MVWDSLVREVSHAFLLPSRRVLAEAFSVAKMQSPFKVRRDSPFPSRSFRHDLLAAQSSGSNTTGLGLRDRSESSVDIMSSVDSGLLAARDRLFFYDETADPTQEFDLLRVDGLARCYHPERLMMVPMVWCVWKDYPGDFQPLECIPPTSIIEYTRRSSRALMFLSNMLTAEKEKPWIANPAEAAEADEKYVAWPGQPDYEQGNVPDEPVTPHKRFTEHESFWGIIPPESSSGTVGRRATPQ